MQLRSWRANAWAALCRQEEQIRDAVGLEGHEKSVQKRVDVCDLGVGAADEGNKPCKAEKEEGVGCWVHYRDMGTNP